MDNQLMTLSFTSTLTDLCEVNSSFDSGILRICYTGKNRNGSYISDETLLKALPTIYNCPVVCNYKRDTNEFGGHDMEVVADSDGGLRLVNLTEPIGVIPESAKTWTAEFEEEDGTIHNYLYAEVLLWKRQEAYRKIKEDGVSAHSMEIKIKSGKKKDDYFEIEDFEFNAFCIIGVAPCFEGSALEVFNLETFKQKMSEMMCDYKDTFNLVATSNEDNNKFTQNNLTEGGKAKLEEKMELIAKYGIDVDSLDFSIEDFSVEELTEKFEAMKKANSEPEDNKSFALIGNIVGEIRRKLREETITCDWGECPRFCYADCDIDALEVYAWDSRDWLLYGFAFSIDGDAITIDFSSQKRKKFVIADFEGGEQISPFAEMFSLMNDKLKECSEFESKFNEAETSIASLNSELTELRKFKEDVENENARNEREEVFAQFEDLVGIDAFEELRSNCSDIDIETLIEKCFAIRGKNGTTQKFSSKEVTPKLKVVKTNIEDNKSPYGGIVEKFANKH